MGDTYPSQMAQTSRRITKKDPGPLGTGRRGSPMDGHVIGVDIGGSNLRIALADTKGNILGKWSASTRQSASPEMVIDQICKGTKHVLSEASVPERSVLAIAAGSPGLTDGDAGVVIATSYLKGWRDVPFRKMLESAFRIPAAVENDVRLGAIGENWKGAARDVRDFVFLAVGTGIAAGIVVDGKLLRGTDFTAGEVGYMHVPGTPEHPARHGEPGSLESIIGGEGIRQQWLRCGESVGQSRPHDVTATEIFDRARDGDALAATVLNRSARVLAYAVYNISLVLNCQLFVLGGSVGMSAPWLEATRRALLQYSAPAHPKLVISNLGKDAQLVGAIRLALNRAEIASA